MALAHFGYGTSEVTTNGQGAPVGGIQLTVWTADTGGMQVTDLYDYHTGDPLPGYVTSETGASVGRFGCQASSAYGALFFDDGNPAHMRWRVNSLESAQNVGPALKKSQEALDVYTTVLGVTLPDDGSRPLPVFDAVYHGCKGDGSTDDTAKLQEMATELVAAGGGILRLTPGKTFFLDGFIDASGGNIWVWGYGARVLKKAGRSSYTFLGARSRGTAGYGAAGSGFRLSGVTMIGDGATGGCLFAGHHADNVLVEDCSMLGVLAGGHGLDLAACRGVTVKRSAFAGRLTGNTRQECIQADCSVDGGGSVPDDAGSYDGLPSQDVTVDNCRFVKYQDLPAPMPFGSHSVPGVGGAAGLGKFYDKMTFSNNWCESAEDNPGSTPRGLVHFVAARGIRVTGNHFINADGTDVPAVGIFDVADVPGTGRIRCDDVIVSANRFEGVTATQPAVYVASSDSVRVHDNRAAGVGCGSNGVFAFSGVNRLLVRGNDLSAAAGTQPTGIAADSTSAQGRIESNIATGFTTGVASASATVTAANNITA